MKTNSSKEKVTITMNGQPFEVPPGGTLGILALGNVGIKAWKQAKAEWSKSTENGKKEKK
jgi:hypothetical protein